MKSPISSAIVCLLAVAMAGCKTQTVPPGAAMPVASVVTPPVAVASSVATNAVRLSPLARPGLSQAEADRLLGRYSWSWDGLDYIRTPAATSGKAGPITVWTGRGWSGGAGCGVGTGYGEYWADPHWR